MLVENLKITKIQEVQEGTSKAGKAWKKVQFIGETDEQYNNLYAFDIFQGEGKEAVDNFIKFNKVGDVVNVEFNVQCQEWQEKFYTNLSAWIVKKAEGAAQEAPAQEDQDLPF